MRWNRGHPEIKQVIAHKVNVRSVSRKQVYVEEYVLFMPINNDHQVYAYWKPSKEVASVSAPTPRNWFLV
jgi:hypothetical protein